MRFRQAVACHREVLAGGGTRPKRFGENAGVAIALRQLVRAEEKIGEIDARVGGQDMSGKLRAQAIQHGLRQRARGDGVARPGQHRQGQNQARGITLPADFAGGFNQIGEVVIGARVAVVETVESLVERLLVAVAQELFDQRGHFRFQPGIFQAAAGIGQRLGQPGQAFACRGEAGTSGAAAFHGGSLCLFGLDFKPG